MTFRSRLLAAVGAEAVIAVLVAVGTHLWGLDPHESWAIILGGAVLVSALMGGIVVGLAAACLASATYVGLRASAIDALGFSPLEPRIVLWVVVYGAFGVLGGWASGVLGFALGHLEEHNRIDPATGLGNARRFLDLTGEAEGSELERLRRFGTAFSVLCYTVTLNENVRVRVVGAALAIALPRRADHLCHVDLGHGEHLFAAVLAGTSMTGAEVVSYRLAAILDRYSLAVGAQQLEHATILPGSAQRGYEAYGLEHLEPIRAKFQAAVSV
jgi:hypothetical protein